MKKLCTPASRTLGKLLVFTGSKGGSGVTTVACNVAIALAQRTEQKTLLIDLALPIGDAALCLGIAAGYSTEDALRNIERLDAGLLQIFSSSIGRESSCLRPPPTFLRLRFPKDAIDKLIAVARREFDHVIVDVGSRIDVAAKVLFEHASTNYLVIQTGISELRNSNRLISQFFTDGSRNLEIVINRFDSIFTKRSTKM
jgi:pilus assembly protein CpaE